MASCIVTPSIAAITLRLCGHASFSQRLGVNARYASLGAAASAALLGLCAWYLSERAVFIARRGGLSDQLPPAEQPGAPRRRRPQQADEAARDAAVHAAEQIRFKPALKDGQPYDSTAVLHIIFQLA